MMALKTVVQTRIIFPIILAVILKTVETADRMNIFTDGVITSKNYPSNYPNDFEGIYMFEVSPERKIKLVFDDFTMEGGTQCPYDHILAYDGPTTSYPLLGRFCGSNRPHVIISTSNLMLMVFKTDGSQIFKGFKATLKTELNIKAIVPRETETNLVQYFLSTIRQQTSSINKWGKDITRSAVALFLHDPRFFATGNYTGEEIAYELSLQLMSKLVMRKRISTKDLALFINAMTVSCINPRKFFGVNIVDELHKRIERSNHTNPFFILTICNSGKIIETEYVHKLQQLFETPLQPSWTGTQAMIVMALKCISQLSTNMNLKTTLAKMIAELKSKQQNNGTVEDLKTTALVIQALMATESYGTDFNLSMAIKSILRDMKHIDLNTENIYYILPIFEWRTLLDIKSSHCGNFIQTDLEDMKALIHEKTDERIQVQISVIIGDDMDLTRTWRMKVPSNFSLYQIMENVSSSDIDYKVRYTIIDGKPYISALGRFEYSIEDGLFWFIYRKALSSTGDLILLEDSPVDIRVSETDELILWYNSGSPPSTQYDEPNTTDGTTITMDTTDTETVMNTAYSDRTYDDISDMYIMADDF